MSNTLLSKSDKPVTFLAVSDRVLAKEFYINKLGLELRYEDDFALVLDSGVTSLRISETTDFEPQPFTVLGWEVSNIVLSAQKLLSMNIQPKRYDGLEQSELGVWCSPSTSVKIVWFEDPAGNLLSLSEA